jgi:hypothetical protein
MKLLDKLDAHEIVAILMVFIFAVTLFANKVIEFAALAKECVPK